ncbi:MAG: hypothetical protein N2645_03435 [Clostridia bacterium]|nr:hypothetical protein [Clostridia bacterium]
MKIIHALLRIRLLNTYRLKKQRIFVDKALLSKNGNFIDVRYRLSRPDKCTKETAVFMVDEETGQKLYLVNFVQFDRIKKKYAGKVCNDVFLFYNRGGVVRKGSKVSLFLGALNKEHIEVI